MKNFDLEAWKGLSASSVSDALDRLGLGGQCLGIKPLSRDFKIMGPAFTVKYVAQNEEKGTVGDYIEDVSAGDVIVIDNEGRQDATVWGDLLTRYAKVREVGGTVINGVCRDSSASLDFYYPIFSRGVYMRTGKDRVQYDGMNIPVAVGDVKIHPGDLIIGDADGVVAVPAQHIEKVLSSATEIEKNERGIIGALEGGMSLKQARETFGYHYLQRKTN